MKQVFQDLRSGVTLVEEVPVPTPPPGQLLIRTQASLISAGTERMLADFGRSNYLDKARQQPDKVRQVLDKARTDGIRPTIDAVQQKLNELLPMGYANAGEVIEVGAGVTDFTPGDLVASNGVHAEWVTVPTTLAAKVPTDGQRITAEQAAFATVGAIALESVRLAAPTLGERFVVSGLGLVGLLTVQLLRASGCQVLGIDLDPDRLALAERFGARTVDLRSQAPLTPADRFSNGRGVDGVIIAAATSSSEPVKQAAAMCRIRGRIVLVGVTGLELERSTFYEKELTFQVSCSYGPGRYDPDYEVHGHDYPFGHVRWTAARNQQAILDLLASGGLDIDALITHRFPVGKAPDAYQLLLGGESSLGVVLEYPKPTDLPSDARMVTRRTEPSYGSVRPGNLRLGFVGAGNFARRTLLPAMPTDGVSLVAVASRTGTSAAMAGRQFDITRVTTRPEDVLAGDDVDTVFITTRHDSHASLTEQALRAGKHVFVEKPLAINDGELDMLATTLDELGANAPILMVGFNRRFAPQIEAIARQVRDTSPVAITMTVNAGPVPPDSWLNDPAVGGGRIIGEACHFIDLARFLADSPITEVESQHLGTTTRDSAVVSLGFEDGSIATISYLANGHPKLPKERIEVFHRGRVAQLDNFRRLSGLGFESLSPRRLSRQDKGHQDEVAAFLAAVRRGGPSPIPVDQLFEVSRAAIQAAT